MSLPLPKLSRAKRGRQNGDPPHSERGRSASQRKGRYDGGWTPSEQRKRDACMKQFMRNPEGGGTGNSEAYRASSVWCHCGRLNGTHEHGAAT